MNWLVSFTKPVSRWISVCCFILWTCVAHTHTHTVIVSTTSKSSVFTAYCAWNVIAMTSIKSTSVVFFLYIFSVLQNKFYSSLFFFIKSRSIILDQNNRTDDTIRKTLSIWDTRILVASVCVYFPSSFNGTSFDICASERLDCDDNVCMSLHWTCVA